jgi:hypothetical protein
MKKKKSGCGFYQTRRMSFIYMKFAAGSDENESQCLVNRDVVTVPVEFSEKSTSRVRDHTAKHKGGVIVPLKLGEDEAKTKTHLDVVPRCPPNLRKTHCNR